MQSRLGRCGFEARHFPVPGKSEWGMDTLSLRMEGHSELLPDFVRTLAQGQVYMDGTTPFYLQTWAPDESTPVASVTLLYKGLRNNATPAPKIDTVIQPATGNTSASFSSENSGFGRIYRKQPLWQFAYTAPDHFVEDAVAAPRDIYTVSATLEFTYDAVQTVYRYITIGRTEVPRYNHVASAFVPTIKTARGSTGDGYIFGMDIPAALIDDLQPSIQERVIGFSSSPVIGSPFFECEDVVRKELGNNTIAGTFPQ